MKVIKKFALGFVGGYDIGIILKKSRIKQMLL